MRRWQESMMPKIVRIVVLSRLCGSNVSFDRDIGFMATYIVRTRMVFPLRRVGMAP
jgi:hypothetical protein